MEFVGKVLEILPAVTGQSARGTWERQTVVFEQANKQFGKEIAVTFMNKGQDVAMLRVGESYTRGAIMHAMLTASCNDLAQALARDSAGSVDKFVQQMNARARRMRMYNSHFVNPSGLPGPQYSTAYDMSLAACYAYTNPIIRDFINDQQVVLTRPNGQQVNFNNTNKLLPKYHWVQGMKTGYTNAAKRCLISCGSLNGRAVIVVVLGCEKRLIWAESEKYLRWALGV